jgi:hypothetical protein
LVGCVDDDVEGGGDTSGGEIVKETMGTLALF